MPKKKNIHTEPEVSYILVNEEQPEIVVAKFESEEAMIARIKSGHGYDDEYTDKYHKPFPRG